MKHRPYIGLFVFFFLAQAQAQEAESLPVSSSLPTTMPTSSPNSAPSSTPVTTEPNSLPTTIPDDETNIEETTPTTEEAQPENTPSSQDTTSAVNEDLVFLSVGRALPLPPIYPLVLRGIPRPVRRLHLGLQFEHIVLTELSNDIEIDDKFSLESLVLNAVTRIAPATTLELRVPVVLETTSINDNAPQSTTTLGNLFLGLSRVFGGATRYSLSAGLTLPTAGQSESATRSAIPQRYELPLFLPGTFSVRTRASIGRSIGNSGITAELGLDSIFRTQEDSALQVASEFNIRGGLSGFYRVSPFASFVADITFSKSLTGGEDGKDALEDGLAGNLDDVTTLHIGGRVFVGRITFSGFLSVPQDNPLGDLSTVGLGFNVSSALF